jgi:hypothetical protein
MTGLAGGKMSPTSPADTFIEQGSEKTQRLFFCIALTGRLHRVYCDTGFT